MLSSQTVSHQKGCKNLIIMQNYLKMEGLYINDFHRSNSMAAQREVRRMSLHPYSREQMLQQIAEFKKDSTSKESANEERSKRNI